MFRKIPLENEHLYHVYNRGTDKRKIFVDKNDYLRFLISMREFNRADPIGSLLELKERREVENASNILSTAKEEAYASKRYDLNNSLIEIAVAYISLERHEDVIKTINEISSNDKAKALHSIALKYIQADQKQKALMIAKDIQKPEKKVDALVDIVALLRGADEDELRGRLY